MCDSVCYTLLHSYRQHALSYTAAGAPGARRAAQQGKSKHTHVLLLLFFSFFFDSNPHLVSFHMMISFVGNVSMYISYCSHKLSTGEPFHSHWTLSFSAFRWVAQLGTLPIILHVVVISSGK